MACGPVLSVSNRLLARCHAESGQFCSEICDSVIGVSQTHWIQAYPGYATLRINWVPSEVRLWFSVDILAKRGRFSIPGPSIVGD